MRKSWRGPGVAGLVGAVAVVGAAAALGLGSTAKGTTVVSPDAVLDLRIADFEERYQGPFDLLIGTRLAESYTQRFAVAADPEDIDRSQAVLAELVAAWPDRSALRNRLASLYITQHRFGDAFDLAADNVEDDSTDQGALGVLFDAAMAIGRYETAEATLGKMDADAFGRRTREARWMDAQGEDREARRILREACEEIEWVPSERLLVAWCFTRLAALSSSAEAAAWHERALAAWPDYRGVLEARADEAYAAGDWPRARELYLGLASDAHPDLFLRLTEVEGALGNTGAAQAWTARFLEVASPRDVEPLFAQSLAVHLAGADATRPEALAVMLRDVERRPSIENYAILAWVQLASDRPAEALDALGPARRFGVPSADTEYLLARALEALGRGAEAAGHRVVAEADPGALAHHLQAEIRAGR